VRTFPPLLVRIAVALVVAIAGCSSGDARAPLSAADRQLIRDNVLSRVPNIGFVVNADLDGKLVYLGCDVDKTEVSPGESFKIVHYWEVLDPPGPDWKIFTHLGPRVVILDHVPIKGRYPIREWNAGEIIRDEQDIQVPLSWDIPFVFLYVGVYHASVRLPVRSGEHDGANRVVALRLPVRGASREALVPEMDVRRAWRAPVIDGRLEDPTWSEIDFGKALVHAVNGGSIFPNAEVKMLWDDKFIYLGMKATDAVLKPRDGFFFHLSTERSRDVLEVKVTVDGRAVTVDPNTPSKRRRRRDQSSPSPRFSVVAAVRAEEIPARSPKETEKKAPHSPAAGLSSVPGSRLVSSTLLSEWTAEVAVPWAALPGGPIDPGTVFRLRANVVRDDWSSDRIQISSAWSPSLGAEPRDPSRLGILNLADDVGIPIVSRAAPRGSILRDVAGEMRGLTPDR
jgi:hypothetical protein